MFHFCFVLLLCGVGVKISEGSRVPCILFYLSLALFSLQLEQKDESLVSSTSLGLLCSEASIKYKLPFFQKKRNNKCFSHYLCNSSALSAQMTLITPLCKHTHIIDGVSVGPLTGATLPKARNILYASMLVLIAKQVKRLLALLLSKMRQTTIHNVMQVTLKYHYYKLFLHLCCIPIFILFVLNSVQNYNYCVPNGCRPLLK